MYSYRQRVLLLATLSFTCGTVRIRPVVKYSYTEA
jgi:hypothetical protein